MGKIALIDLDKTLFGPDYQLNCETPALRAAVEAVQAEGVQIGLNSDTPLRTLRQLHKSWGMNGPIVAELGAVLWLPPDKRAKNGTVIQVVEDLPWSDWRTDFQNALRKAEIQYYNGHALDVPKLRKSPPFKGEWLLVNTFRQYSASFWAFRTGQQTMPCGPLLQECWDIFLSIVGETPMDVDLNQEYGVAIAHPKGVAKTDGVSLLINYCIGDNIFQIGDSEGDIIAVEDVTHCAVGNATKNFKEVARLHSDQNLTLGVIDLLGQIAAF